MEKLLLGGATLKEIWTYEVSGKWVYLVAYKFQTYGFLQDYQYAQASVRLLLPLPQLHPTHARARTHASAIIATSNLREKQN